MKSTLLAMECAGHHLGYLAREAFPMVHTIQACWFVDRNVVSPEDFSFIFAIRRVNKRIIMRSQGNCVSLLSSHLLLDNSALQSTAG